MRTTPAFTYHHVFEPAERPGTPALLLLHGTGGTEHDLLRLGRTLSPGSALISPRGDVSEGGALRFFARLREGVFDPAEVARRTHALADFIAAACRHYGIEQLIAVGFSNGANIAGTLLLLRPDALNGAILWRPMVVLDQPAPAGTLSGKRVLISSGKLDPLMPADHPDRLAALFRAGGAEVTLESQAASHALVPADLASAQAWLQR
ncbi:MAG: hypothetical protein RIQ93_2907 [Verrucomicrobiota bacterium]|jgi:predicted esterase